MRFAILVLGNFRWELRPFVKNIRHFVLTIMLNERLEADLFQHLPRSLFVDGETQSVYRLLRVGLGPEFVDGANDHLAVALRSVGLNFVPSEYPYALA